MVKSLASLLIIGLVCGSLLSAVHHQTEAPIAANQAKAARTLLQSILPELPADVDVAENSLGNCGQWRAERFSVTGYAGAIHLVGVWRGASNTFTLRVVEHSETPGIGDFIDIKRNSWIAQYDRSSLETYTDMDNVSGATVTIRAMRNAAQTLDAIIRQDCDV